MITASVGGGFGRSGGGGGGGATVHGIDPLSGKTLWTYSN